MMDDLLEAAEDAARLANVTLDPELAKSVAQLIGDLKKSARGVVPSTGLIVPNLPSQELSPDEVTACWGEEKYSPVQFNFVAHGPFYAKVRLRPGESPEQALMRGMDVCRTVAAKSWPVRRDAFLDRLKDIEEGSRGTRRGR